MPKIDLDAIEARANAATKGPWGDDAYVGEDPYDDPDQPFVQVGNVRWVAGGVEIPAAIQQKRDAEFIAHARTDVPNLVAKVRELEAEVERLQGEREAGVKLAHMSFNQTLKCRGDNAALRLAATELYEFVTRDCGLESHGADAIGRMANVLGLDK